MKVFIGSSLIALSASIGLAVDLPSEKEWSMLKMLNDLRAQGHTCSDGTVHPPNPVPIEWDCRLFDASRAHSRDMHDGHFQHYGTDGSSPRDRGDRAGVQSGGIWENIAAGNLIAGNSFDQWVTSSGHCNNMLNADRKAVGIGYDNEEDDRYDHYWTMNLMNVAPRSEDKDCYLTPSPTLPPVPTVAPSPYPTYDNGLMMQEDAMFLFNKLNENRRNGCTCNQGSVKEPVPELQWNCALWRAAKVHAADMAANGRVSHTGTDGSSHGDRAELQGTRFGCQGMVFLKGDGQEAYDYYYQMMCSYYIMETRYKSMGAARVCNPDVSSKCFWVVMMNDYETEDSNKECYSDDMFQGNTLNPTPQTTPAPVATTPNPTTAPQPTPNPTDAPQPTANPTVAPQPTANPTVAPQPTPSPTDVTAVKCKNIDSQDLCNGASMCAWKGKNCKEKSKLCPGLNAKKCVKYDCNYIDGVCGWEIIV